MQKPDNEKGPSLLEDDPSTRGIRSTRGQELSPQDHSPPPPLKKERAAPLEAAHFDKNDKGSTLNSAAVSPLSQLVSCYGRVKSFTNTTSSVLDILAVIKSDKHRDITEKINATADKVARRKLKERSLSAMTLSGTFAGRHTAVNIEKHTGLFQVDLDGMPDEATAEAVRGKLCQCPHIAAVWPSPSGGVKGIFYCPAPEDVELKQLSQWHKEQAYPKIKAEVLAATGETMDAATKDICRCCYISFAAEMFINKHPEPFAVPYVKPTKKGKEKAVAGSPASTNGTHPERPARRQKKNSALHPIQHVELLLSCIPPRPDYSEWLSITAAVRNSLGDNGKAIALLKAWSPEEEEGEYLTKLEGDTFDKIGFGTLAMEAEAWGLDNVIKRFFYAGKQGYGMQCSSDEYIPLGGEAVLRAHLSDIGVPKTAMNAVMCRIRIEQHVDYIGPVAGYPPGVLECNGYRFVVTKGPDLVQPVQGNCDWLDKFFYDLLYDDAHPEQLEGFLDWLAWAVWHVYNAKRGKTPAMALVGPRGCGKSFAIEVARYCLGGRVEKAFAFMSGETTFNAEMLGAELLVIDDDFVSKDARGRAKFASGIKANFFASTMSVMGKNKQSFSARPVHALMMAVNDDAEELRTLPECTEAMRDKIVLNSCSKATLARGGEDGNIAQLTKELPAFLYKLQERVWHTDDADRLLCFWHPAVVDEIAAMSPEESLLAIASNCEPIKGLMEGGMEWVGTSHDLQALLTSNECPMRQEVNRLLSWNKACGTFLGRLAKSSAKNGVSFAGTSPSKTRRYKIEAPEGFGEQELPF